MCFTELYNSRPCFKCDSIGFFLVLVCQRHALVCWPHLVRIDMKMVAVSFSLDTEKILEAS